MSAIGSIVPRWIAAHACACAALCVLTTAAFAQVSVVTRVPEDREVAPQLSELLAARVGQRPAPADRSLFALMTDAGGWPEQHLVVIDRRDPMIHVLRPRHRTYVTRMVAADLLLDARGVALAAAELLEWSGVLPAPRGAPVGSSAQAADASVDAPIVPGAAAPPPRAALGWGLGADLELAMHPGYDVSLARASIAAELQLGRRRGPTWWAFGARLGAPATWDRELPPSEVPGVAEIEYSDVVAGLHAALGYGAGRATVLAQLEGGLTFVRLEALAPDASIVDEHHGPAAFLGLGVGLRYPLIWGLSVAAAVQAHWLVERETYRVGDAVVLEEGPIRVATRVGVIWESALFHRSP